MESVISSAMGSVLSSVPAVPYYDFFIPVGGWVGQWHEHE